MAKPILNLGCDVRTLSLSRSNFFGGASASATSDYVSADQYRRVTAMISTTTPSANTVSAAGLVATYVPQWSSDGGTTWVSINEINGSNVNDPAHNPTTTGVNRAYVYPAILPLFRMKVTGTGHANTGISASISVSLMP